MSSYTTPEKKHYTVSEQKDRLPLYLREFYETRQLDRIKIDGNEIQGYFEYSFFEDKTYVKSPERSSDGTIVNLDSYSSFLTPRLVIKYNYMHIGDYRKLMLLIYSKNEFLVECYDIVRDMRVAHKMYFAPAEMPSIHQRYMEVLGVKDYTIELIGTNVSLDTLEIRYHSIMGGLIADATQYVTKGTEAIIYHNLPSSEFYRFEGEWKDAFDVIYHNNDVVTVSNDIDLYPITKPTTQFTLSFSYGNGNVLNSQVGGAITNVTIASGQTISAAIASANITLDNGSQFAFPESGTGGLSVLYEDNYVAPYDFKGWYWTPVANEGTRVNGSTTYDYSVNRTIYQIYEPKKHNVTYVTNTNGAISISTLQVGYGGVVTLPALRMTGFTFIGWYTDEALTKMFSGTMPPKNLTLYAKWEANQ